MNKICMWTTKVELILKGIELERERMSKVTVWSGDRGEMVPLFTGDDLRLVMVGLRDLMNAAQPFADALVEPKEGVSYGYGFRMKGDQPEQAKALKVALLRIEEIVG